ncbi:MAG: tetratricopeptide repeat protein [Nitrospirae bacterium]|nr:tetratricopeptide repeat protein [Nitrospirota bacterium]
MEDNNTNITIKILDASKGQYAVYIDDALSHHVGEGDIARILTRTRNNRWRNNHDVGVELGMQLYDLLNRGTVTLQNTVDAAKADSGHTNLYLQMPYKLTQLPFELLHNGSFFVLLKHDIHVIRLVEDRGELSRVEPDDGTIRMLFIACSPTDLHVDKLPGFEEEEERIFDAIGNCNIGMRVEDTGSVEGLGQTNIASGGFDVIHITGHVGFDKKMGPVFHMEDEVGKSKKVSPAMLWDAIKDFPPGMLFISGCSTDGAYDVAHAESFAYMMAQKGLRWVVAWGLPVSDDGATILVAEVYRRLATDMGIDSAVQSARRLRQDGYHPWPLLKLFGDASPVVPPVADAVTTSPINPVTLRYRHLNNGSVRVLDSGFVGRRRYIQRGVGVFRASGKQGLLVHGQAGVGKTCLVGEILEHIKDYELLVFQGAVSENNVILKLITLFDEKGNADAMDILKSHDKYDDKIKALFSNVVKTQPFSVITYFDAFEQNLVYRDNQYYVRDDIKDIIRPLLFAADWSKGKCNVVITSRYPFILEHNGKDLSRTKLYDIPLMPLDGADPEKKIRGLQAIATSKHAGLYRVYGGGNPRLLEWLNVIAGDEGRYDVSALGADLQGRPPDYVHEYLADVLATTAGEGVRKFVRKASVYGMPVDATAFEGIGGEFLDAAVELTLVEREVRAALAIEVPTSPAIKDPVSGESVYRVPLSISDVMWGKLTAEEQLQMHGHAYRWYDRRISSSPETDYRYLEQAVRHALALDNIHDSAVHALALGRYFNKKMALPRQGLAAMAAVALRVSNEVIEEAKENRDIELCEFLNEYANLLWKSNDSRQSILFHGKALAIYLEVHGEINSFVADAYEDIAGGWQTLGDARRALVFFEKSLAIRLTLYGETHKDVAVSYRNIGSVVKSLGDSPKAIEYHEKSLAIARELFGEENDDVAGSYNNIGLALKAAGQARQAITYYEKAIAILTKLHGEDHPVVASSYNNIGNAFETSGDSRQAIEYHKKALAIFKKLYGERHPIVANSYNNLGSAFDASGEAKPAIALFKKSLAIWLDIYGEKHPYVAASYKHLANSHMLLGDMKQAMSYLAKAKAAWP